MTAARGKSGEVPLCELVRDSLDRYFEDLNGQVPANLYELVLAQVERPLFETVMRETGGNMSRAADMLGMNRATLRQRLEKYGLKKQR